MDAYLKDVAIIGAGLGGCALALALSDLNIPITIYESRPEASPTIHSGVILTPNGLRALDHLGVFARIKGKCYVPQFRIFKNRLDETTKKVPAGDPDRYGYLNHRLWRRVLLDEMRRMLVVERGITIHYNSKFNGILSDDDDDDTSSPHVTYLINSTPHTSSLLLGTDGIYSSVRTALFPAIQPTYTGLIGIIAHIKRSSIAWPYASYESNVTIQDSPGAIFWIAEDPAGEELMIARQVAHPRQSRRDLEDLQRDQERLLRFFTDDYEAFGETARKIIDELREQRRRRGGGGGGGGGGDRGDGSNGGGGDGSEGEEELYIWPFMKMPVLEKWYSNTGRVVLLGDAAHALPPSSGQGVNQALEDVYSLTLLLGSLKERHATGGNFVERGGFVEALGFWQKIRQERLDAVMDWTTHGANVSRLSVAERDRLIAEGKVKDQQYDDMSWLFQPGVYDGMQAWVEGKAW